MMQRILPRFLIAVTLLVVVMASRTVTASVFAHSEAEICCEGYHQPRTFFAGPSDEEPSSRINLPLLWHDYLKPFPWEGSDAPGFLEYDDDEYWVYLQEIAGRPVTIAWDKDAGVSENHCEEVSEFYFSTVQRWVDLFGSFPYASYTVVLRRESQFLNGEHGIGYEALAKWYNNDRYRQRVAHEVFHVWVGNFIQDDWKTKRDEALWFREGITQYYGDRGAGESGSSNYYDLMQDHWRRYRNEILGTEYDIPLSDMPAAARDLDDSQYRLNVYWKGALVAYMMDLRLRKSGLSLDDFMVYMYHHYGFQRQRFFNADAKQALTKISNQNWDDFFDMYIYGTTPLPLDGDFVYLPD